MKPNPHRFLTALVLFVGLAAAQRAQAQWATESYPLKAGWNAIWLPIDCGHGEIHQVIPDLNIEQVWRWNPLPSTQFTVDPQTPVAGDSQWDVWRRSTPLAPHSTLFALTGNAAYLVKVADSVGAGTITLALKGKPVAPRYPWKESGLNFFGFSTSTPVGPNFETFLSHSPALAAGPAIFAYRGGAGLDPAPVRVTAPRTELVARGGAFWIQSTQYTDYSGPLKLTASTSTFDFGTERYTASMRIKNVTAATLTASIANVTSELPPAGQAASVGNVPLQVRGQFNPVTAVYAYSALPHVVTLAAGEEKEIVFTLGRGGMGAAAGSEYQSLLRITDSLGLTRIDLPARAVTTSLAGIWIGEAGIGTVDRVAGSTLTPEANAGNNQFPLRFIVHRAGSGVTTLLQQVFIGEGHGAAAGTRVAATAQTSIDPAKLATASRLSTATLPHSLGAAGTAFRVTGSGTLGLSGDVTFPFTLGAGNSTNPFLHAYHPDHGPTRSLAIVRTVKLSFDTALAAGDPTFGSTTLGGVYSEEISGLRAGVGPLRVSGRFVLRRVAEIPTLTIP